MFTVADFDPHGEDAPVVVVCGVVHLEVGDVCAGIGDDAGDVGEQARVFVGFDPEFGGKEAFAFACPDGADAVFVAGDVA